MEEKKKITTYVTIEVWAAVKQLAHEKDVPIATVIEQALRRQIPDKYFNPRS